MDADGSPAAAGAAGLAMTGVFTFATGWPSPEKNLQPARPNTRAMPRTTAIVTRRPVSTNAPRPEETVTAFLEFQLFTRICKQRKVVTRPSTSQCRPGRFPVPYSHNAAFTLRGVRLP